MFHGRGTCAEALGLSKVSIKAWCSSESQNSVSHPNFRTFPEVLKDDMKKAEAVGEKELQLLKGISGRKRG